MKKFLSILPIFFLIGCESSINGLALERPCYTDDTNINPILEHRVFESEYYTDVFQTNVVVYPISNLKFQVAETDNQGVIIKVLETFSCKIK